MKLQPSQWGSDKNLAEDALKSLNLGSYRKTRAKASMDTIKSPELVLKPKMVENMSKKVFSSQNKRWTY